MTQKREGQLWLPSHPGEAGAEWRAQRGEARRTDIGQLPGFDVAPELFDRVQVRRKAGQPLDRHGDDVSQGGVRSWGATAAGSSAFSR